MATKERQIPKRVNFFDGQRVTESELDAEQIHKTSVTSDIITDFHGSGVLDGTPISKSTLLDTRFPGKHVLSTDENESKEDIESGSYDGKPIYLDKQPSDNIRGNRITLELIDSDVIGRKTTKALILGWAFDGINEQGQLVNELVEFKSNKEMLSKYYYRKVISILFNNFSGGTGRTELLSSADSEDLITANGGYLIVKEAEPLKVYPNADMSFQVESPNVGLRDFITSDTSLSIRAQIEEALGSAVSISDMYIETTGKEQIKFESDASSTLAYGQKFLSKSNNIQRVDLLLSVDQDTSASIGAEFDWSGDLVLSIHELMSEPKCATDAVPNDQIDFDPELSPIVELSFNQDDLSELGFVLDATPKIVSFNLAGTLIADPNIAPSIEVNKHYALLISRRGDNRTGNLVLEKCYDKVTKKNEDGVPLSTLEQFGKQESKFVEYDPNTLSYIDDSTSSLWYIIHSNDIEVTSGTAYSDDGFAVTLEKTQEFVGGSEISKFERHISLADISSGSKNYVILSHVEEFVDSNVHPRTGDHIFTRIKDTASISVVNAAGLESVLKDTTPLLLAKVVDKNVRDAQSITGEFNNPGMIYTDKVVISNPSSELQASNLVGRILIPDTNCECTAKYRIAKVGCEILKAGDLNRDGELTNSDIGPLLDVVGNTINSEFTERNILGGALDLTDFILSDLDANDTVDGFDIELLEDAVDGYVNFTVAEEIKFLTLYLENILESSNSPTIFTDTASSGFTTISTDNITFTADTENIASLIRIGDSVSIESSSADSGVYIVTSKTISSDNLTVLLEVSDSTGAEASFSGDSGFNITITSGTEVNTLADNNKLVDIPFSSSDYEIAFVEAPFNDLFLDICDLRRFVGVSFLEEQDNSCLCQEDDCLPVDPCTPLYKNQVYIPDDMYINGEILSPNGNPYHGDIEYSKIEMPLPPGSISDCSVNLYTNFIKASDSTSCKTAAGYPAMKYSDGTYVGCEDSGSNTDLTKGRVKIDHAIASLYVDALIDGYATDGYADETLLVTDSQVIAESFIDNSFNSFSSWTADPSNNTSVTTITNPSGVNQPAIFELTSVSDSGERFGKLDVPSIDDDFEGDFVIDWTALRTVWPGSSMTSGVIKSGMILDISNGDGSSTVYELGWLVRSDGASKLYFEGNMKNTLGSTISTFIHEVAAPETLGDEVLFRFRRINDVVTAHYIVSSAISGSGDSFGQYIRIGTNPTVQAGAGSGSITFQIIQDGGPTAGLSFFSKLNEVVIRSEYTSTDTPTSLTIGRDSVTEVIDRAALTFAINLTSKTNIVSATLLLTSNTSGTISDTFNVIPLDILNADNLGKYYDYPTVQDPSLTTSFIPGVVTIGGEISVDITSAVIAMMAEPGHLPGFLKGFILEPDISANSEFNVSVDTSLEIGYEDATTGVIFKVGVSIDGSTGIATLNTKNILYDSMIEELRTVLNFGIYLKKSGFANNDLYVSIEDLNRIGVGTCSDETVLDESDECFFVTGSTTTGTFIEGPFPCAAHLP